MRNVLKRGVRWLDQPSRGRFPTGKLENHRAARYSFHPKASAGSGPRFAGKVR